MNLSYNISEHLRDYLTKTEKLRTDILLQPLSPKNELRLKWDINLERIIWGLALEESQVSKSDVVKLLSYHYISPKKQLDRSQKEILGLKNAFSYIKEFWMATRSPVSMTTIKKLYEISCRPLFGPPSGLTEYSEKRINSLLEYLQRGQDHPLIQAGIVQVETINITPFDNGNGKVARLLSYLFLYKNGYDFRKMLILEEYYKRDIVTYRRMLEMAKIQGNMTVWLEYFVYGISTALEKSLDIAKNLKFQEELPASFWRLNSRQREVLEIFEVPGQKITNKDLQKLYGVSQITASRDLAHMTNLNLLLAHGKGRSVYYTRV